MVQLTKIYTRTGDAGSTRLSDLSEVAKTDLRVEAYGDVDEANSVLGVVTAGGLAASGLEAMLRHIQNELFDVGADLSTPIDPACSQQQHTQRQWQRFDLGIQFIGEHDSSSLECSGHGTISAAPYLGAYSSLAKKKHITHKEFVTLLTFTHL